MGPISYFFLKKHNLLLILQVKTKDPTKCILQSAINQGNSQLD